MNACEDALPADSLPGRGVETHLVSPRRGLQKGGRMDLEFDAIELWWMECAVEMMVLEGAI